MYRVLLTLGRETAIYGTSTIVGRFLTFLLVPFYTNVLSASDYGIVATAYSYIAFLNVLYVFGMEAAFFKYASTEEIGTREENFSTPFLTLGLLSLLLSGLLLAFAEPLARLTGLGPHGPSIVRYSAGILLFDNLSVIPFAALRLAGKAMEFARVRLLNIVVNVALNVWFLVHVKRGLLGIFEAGILSSAFSLGLLVPVLLALLRLRIRWDLLRALLRFGLPYVPAGLGAIALQVVDRPILKALTNDATVGIYQANHRLGIFMMVLVAMFEYAWRPFFLKQASSPNAKALFARVMTYFLLVAAGLLLAVSFLLPVLVRIRFGSHHLIHPSYWIGLGIVPTVLLGYLFLGVYTNLLPGIYIEKRTEYLPLVSGIAVIVNVSTNFLLIPVLGMLGCALAHLLAYAALAVAIGMVVTRIYPVSYEIARILKIALAGALAFALYSVLEPHLGVGLAAILPRSALLAVFVALLVILRFFEPRELTRFREMLRRNRPTTSSSATAPLDRPEEGP